MVLRKEIQRLLPWDYSLLLLPREWRSEIGFSPSDDEWDGDEAGDGDGDDDGGELQLRMWSFFW